MRGKIYGYTAFVLCGVAIYLAGYACGELKRHDSSSQMYFQGYRTGYIKGFRRVQKEVQQQIAIEVQPLRLNGQQSKAPVDRVANDTVVINQN